jgi:hypothetical protein
MRRCVFLFGLLGVGCDAILGISDPVTLDAAAAADVTSSTKTDAGRRGGKDGAARDGGTRDVGDREASRSIDAGSEGGRIDGGSDAGRRSDGASDGSMGQEDAVADGATSQVDAVADGATSQEDAGEATDAACTTALCTLASGQNQPAAIAVDSSHVYWTTFAGDTVMSVPLAGGIPKTLASNQFGADGIAVDSTTVYWTDANTGGTVMKVPKAGGTPTTLASNQNIPEGIAVDSTTVYWTVGGATATSGLVMSVPLGGGTPKTLASGQSGPQSIAVNATSLYWTNADNPVALIRAQLDGTTPTTLVSESTPGSVAFGDLALDSTSVYFANLDGASIVSIPLAGGAQTTIASGQIYPAGPVAVDSTSVYWVVSHNTTTLNGYLVSAPKTGGGTSTTIYTQQGSEANFGSIAVDSTSIYFSSDSDPGDVMKLTPK